ncbi:PDDEXK nuclease domain-containing protein [Paraburkholderia sp. WC7.3g]|uniref:PDDEXK nuclease domain-containing protein n=1 Tax=Paraburkholderia sp. WC7.3g TaxID=2991070 RepID=UPI003D19C15D
MSQNKRAMLEKGSIAQHGDAVTPEEAIKDPYVLELVDLKDEYSETRLEEALIHRLEDFLLELGSDFAFMGRQRRLRIGDSWFRVDPLFFTRAWDASSSSISSSSLMVSDRRRIHGGQTGDSSKSRSPSCPNWPICCGRVGSKKGAICSMPSCVSATPR